MGGENGVGDGGVGKQEGSSPRGRGKLCVGALCVRGYGLIPAWAGKTGVIPANTVPDWAHPRVGGENLFVIRVT